MGLTPERTTVRPNLRKVPADVLTGLGWLTGTFHVPTHLALSEHLALGARALKFTGVRVPNEAERLSFVALRRDSVVIVAPALADERDAPDASTYTTDLPVACLLPMGMVRGTLRVIYNLRLSDHIQQAGQWLTLHHCLLTDYGATAQSPGARGLHTAIVNLDHATGISECG